MPEHFLYLTTTGRKTGEPRQIEIWFVEREGCYYMVSEMRERSNWVQNIRKDPGVTFSIGTRKDKQAGRPMASATARVMVPEDEPELAGAVKKLMDKKYGWSDGLIVELLPAEGS